MININWTNFDKQYDVSAVVTFPNSSTVSIPKNKIALTGSAITQSSGASVLPLGYVVGRSFTLCIINENREFNNYNWYGATVELTLDYGSSHTVVISDLTIVEPPEYAGLVLTMTAVDNVWRLDKAFSSNLTYPSTMALMLQEICTNCGIDYLTPSSTGSLFSTTCAEKPDAGYTCRQILGYMAAAACGNFRITIDGKLEFVEMSLVTTYSASTCHTVTTWRSLQKAINSVQITGVQVEDEDGETVLIGSEGYVVELEQSPFTKGNELAVVTAVYNLIGDKRFRKFEGSTFSYIKAEVFDRIRFIDDNGYSYIYTIITENVFTLGGGSELSCPIETPKSMGQSFDPGTRAVVTARKLVASERTARQTAEAALAQAIAAKSGLYETTETAQGGGTIYYLHDKSTLAESTNVIKLTSEALGLSTDGGQTYPVGIMINGDVIARILSADGINADWINTGTLVVKDDNYNILFQANINTGYVYIDGMRVDNGMVTLGASGSAKYMRVSDSGVEIIDRGVTTARFSDHGAMFPGKVEFNNNFVIGNYQVLARDDGGVRFVRYFEY